MAAKFIIRKVADELKSDTPFYWILENEFNETLLISRISCATEKEARSNIAMIKKAVKQFTKVEVAK